jgi:hypothetical protein
VGLRSVLLLAPSGLTSLTGFFVICNAIICSVAVWNYSLIHTRGQSCGLLPPRVCYIPAQLPFSASRCLSHLFRRLQPCLDLYPVGPCLEKLCYFAEGVLEYSSNCSVLTRLLLGYGSSVDGQLFSGSWTLVRPNYLFHSLESHETLTAGAAALTAIEPELKCSSQRGTNLSHTLSTILILRTVTAFVDSLCTSARVLLAFTWVGTIIRK